MAERAESDPSTVASPPEPFVSVILVASRHREFLPDALESVRRQNLDPQHWELVVAIDYEDASTERLIRDVGGRSLHVPETALGPVVAAAARASRGTVLSFLDDDDRFLGGKLLRVFDVFRADPNVVFHRNNFAVIGGDGQPQPDSTFRADQRRAAVELGPVVLEGPTLIRRLRELPPLGLGFNSTSMSIRRRTFLEFLERVDLAGFRLADQVIYFAALCGGGKLVLDPSTLNEYRVHNTNASRLLGEETDAWTRRAEFSRRFLPSYESLVDAARSAGIPEVIEEAEGLLAVERGYAAMRRPGARRAEFRNCIREIRQRGRAHTVRSERELALGLWISSLSPQLGRWMYRWRATSVGI